MDIHLFFAQWLFLLAWREADSIINCRVDEGDTMQRRNGADLEK
jgi:hypothetical protein